MLHSIFREMRLFVRILLAGVGCLMLAGALTLWALLCGGLIAFLLFAYALNQQQTEWVVTVAQGVAFKTLYGVDTHALFIDCDDWPTREELERLLAENDEPHRRLSELNACPQIALSQSKCAGKPMLLIEYAGRGDLRAIGEVLEQLEKDAGVALPCRFLNV